jgi:hypothetical protein
MGFRRSVCGTEVHDMKETLTWRKECKGFTPVPRFVSSVKGKDEFWLCGFLTTVTQRRSF